MCSEQRQYAAGLVERYMAVAKNTKSRPAVMPIRKEPGPLDEFHRPRCFGAIAPRMIGALLWLALSRASRRTGVSQQIYDVGKNLRVPPRRDRRLLVLVSH